MSLERTETTTKTGGLVRETLEDSLVPNTEEQLFYQKLFGDKTHSVVIIGSGNRRVYRNASFTQLDPDTDTAISNALACPSIHTPDQGKLSVIDATRARLLLVSDIQIQASDNEYTVYIFPISGLVEETYARVDIHNTSLQIRNQQLEGENTDLRSNLAEVQTANQQLSADKEDLSDRLERSHDIFTMGTHDLRTPLTIMMANAQLLQRHLQTLGIQDQTEANIDTILAQFSRMNLTITETINKCNIWREETRPQVLSATKLLREIAFLNAQLLEPRKIDFIFSFPTEDTQIYTDPIKYGWVLNTLLLNSSQVIDEDGIIALVAEIDRGHLTVYVEDNGIGMTDETQSKCFKKGFRGQKNSNDNGAGAGLSTAKRIAERDLGGKLWIDWSEFFDYENPRGYRIPRGSRFTFSVPLLPEKLT